MAKRKNGKDLLRIDSPESPDQSAAENSALVDTATVSLEDSVFIDLGKHRVEYAVQKELLSHPDLRFSSLVVRRTPNGICLEGVLETTSESPDVCHLARSVAGVGEVINRLMVRRSASLAKT
jgi:osmotically-inducible protein OsmY